MKKFLIIALCLFASAVMVFVSVQKKSCKDVTAEYYDSLGGKEHISQFIEQFERDNICFEWLKKKSALYIFRTDDTSGYPHIFILFTDDGKFHGWSFSDDKSSV